MAASATPRTAEPPLTDAGAPVADAAGGPGAVAASGVIAVAYSGGRDSTALLHATARSAALLGHRVAALHIHHGLSPLADGWLAHACDQVTAWAEAGLPVTLRHERLSGAPAAGESVEAWARAGRHAALQRLALACGADLLLLAHHRRDQAETFLLQALRGAGTAGLAAMPRLQWRDGLCWARPWLDHPREAVQAYVAAHALRFIDDDSNTNTRFARNRLRHELWPELLAQSPGAEAALAQSAAWAQQALELQREMAEQDLAVWAGDAAPADGEAGAGGLGDAAHAGLPGAAFGDGGAPRREALRVTAMLATLSPARAANALRAWLARQLGHAAPARLVERLLRELPQARSGAQWQVPDLARSTSGVASGAVAVPAAPAKPTKPASPASLLLYRGQLTLRTAGQGDQAPATPPPAALTLDLRRPGPHPLPQWHGVLEVLSVTRGGVPASALNKVDLRPREGGEQFQVHARGLPRSLKKCWQSAGVPAAYREGPLVFSAGQLLFVPGLGLDARRLAGPGEPQFTLRWRQNAP